MHLFLQELIIFNREIDHWGGDPRGYPSLHAGAARLELCNEDFDMLGVIVFICDSKFLSSIEYAKLAVQDGSARARAR